MKQYTLENPGPSEGLMLFAGAVIALAAIKEALRALRQIRVLQGFAHPSRRERLVGLAILERALGRVGSFVVRARPVP